MKLNRAHALFLVGTLAAAACTVEDDDGEGGAGAAGDAGESGEGGSSAGTGGSNAGKGGSAGGKAGSGGSGTSGSAGANDCGDGYAGEMSDCQVAGAPGGSGAPGSSGAPGTGGAADAGGAGGAGGVESGGQGGEDNAGGAPSCDEEALPSTSCEGLSEYTCAADQFIFDMCQVPESVFKGYTADAVRNCLFALSDDELCQDASNVYGCHRTALEASCPDPTAGADCDAIVDYCDGSVERGDCEMYLSGMSLEGRYQMTACIEAGTPESCDLWSCVEGLTYPAVE
jgi:hypothetical protein